MPTTTTSPTGAGLKAYSDTKETNARSSHKEGHSRTLLSLVHRVRQLTKDPAVKVSAHLPDSTSDESNLDEWIDRHGVLLNGVQVQDLGPSFGRGLITTTTLEESCPEPERLMMEVPRSIMLNLEFVKNQCTRDKQLRQVIESCSQQTESDDLYIDTRPAVLAFMLVELTKLCTDNDHWNLEWASPNAWTTYLAYHSPDGYDVPTRWTDEEQECLWGTSLERLVRNKVKILRGEFEVLRANTEDIGWCKQAWWGDDGWLTFNDYLFVDHIWRSRAMDFQEEGPNGESLGECLVPVMDMANHDDADNYICKYAPGANGNPRLELEFGRHVNQGHEVTISYGTRTSADMLITYGFVEDRELSRGIDLLIPAQHPVVTTDPLVQAKLELLSFKPAIHIRADESFEFEFESYMLYALVMREEDGLDLKTFEDVPGYGDVVAFTVNDDPVQTAQEFIEAVRASPNYNYITLKFLRELYDIIEEVIRERRSVFDDKAEQPLPTGITTNSHAYIMGSKLRAQEHALLKRALAFCWSRIDELERSDGIKWREEIKGLGRDAQSNVPTEKFGDNISPWTSPATSTAPSQASSHHAQTYTWHSTTGSTSSSGKTRSYASYEDRSRASYEERSRTAGSSSGDLAQPTSTNSSVDENNLGTASWRTASSGPLHPAGQTGSERGEDARVLSDELTAATPSEVVPRMKFTQEDRERNRVVVRSEYLHDKVKAVNLG